MTYFFQRSSKLFISDGVLIPINELSLMDIDEIIDMKSWVPNKKKNKDDIIVHECHINYEKTFHNTFRESHTKQMLFLIKHFSNKIDWSIKKIFTAYLLFNYIPEKVHNRKFNNNDRTTLLELIDNYTYNLYQDPLFENPTNKIKRKKSIIQNITYIKNLSTVIDRINEFFNKDKNNKIYTICFKNHTVEDIKYLRERNYGGFCRLYEIGDCKNFEFSYIEKYPDSFTYETLRELYMKNKINIDVNKYPELAYEKQIKSNFDEFKKSKQIKYDIAWKYASDDQMIELVNYCVDSRIYDCFSRMIKNNNFEEKRLLNIIRKVLENNPMQEIPETFLKNTQIFSLDFVRTLPEQSINNNIDKFSNCQVAGIIVSKKYKEQHQKMFENIITIFADNADVSYGNVKKIKKYFKKINDILYQKNHDVISD